MTPPTRRSFLVTTGMLLAAGAGGVAGFAVGRRARQFPRPAPATPEAALAELRAGNAR